MASNFPGISSLGNLTAAPLTARIPVSLPPPQRVKSPDPRADNGLSLTSGQHLWTHIIRGISSVMGDFRIQVVGLDQASSCRCDFPSYFPSSAMAGMPHNLDPFTQQHRSPRAVAISVADPGICARRNVDAQAQGEFDDVKSREVEMLFEMYKSKLDALLGLFGCVHQPSFIRTSQLPLLLYPSAFIARPQTAIHCLSTPTNSFLFFFQDREQGREAAGGIPLDPGEFNFRAITALSSPPQTPKRAKFPRMRVIPLLSDIPFPNIHFPNILAPFLLRTGPSSQRSRQRHRSLLGFAASPSPSLASLAETSSGQPHTNSFIHPALLHQQPAIHVQKPIV